MVSRIEEFIHPDDIWMLNFFKDSDFSLNSLFLHLIIKLVLIVDL